jgi:hypothetical protein
MKNMDAMMLTALEDILGAKQPSCDLVIASSPMRRPGSALPQYLVRNHPEFAGATEAISEVGGYPW